jgi:hypothetical protein
MLLDKIPAELFEVPGIEGGKKIQEFFRNHENSKLFSPFSEKLGKAFVVNFYFMNVLVYNIPFGLFIIYNYVFVNLNVSNAFQSNE